MQQRRLESVADVIGEELKVTSSSETLRAL
jgi:hypothetical protein